MNGDGSELEELISGPLSTSRVSISPDGARFTFDRGESEATNSIVVMSAEGGDGRVVTTLDHAQSPAWSPVGDEIAFSTGGGDLFVVGVGGGEPQRLTNSGDRCGDLYPSWSADGSALAFARDCEGAGQKGLYVVSRDGSGLRLLREGHSILWTAWSPDGSRIAYAESDGRGDGIYSIGPDGKDDISLSPVYGDHLSWSSDGSQIAFVLDHAIQVIPAEGGDPSPVPLPNGLWIYKFDWAD